MNANEVIDSYVADVARRLPRRQRNDVAFELRALIDEELQARLAATGRDADAATAIALVRGFGQPAEVAARYRPPLVVIDPADGHRFVQATVIGLVLIWVLGLVAALQAPIASATDLLRALGHWWSATVVGSLWWPGVLVAGFGLAAWARRRPSRPSAWKPRAVDGIPGGRVAMAMAIVGILCGTGLLIEPRWLLDMLFDGRAAPVAYDALTYTDAFRHRLGPLVLGLVLLNIPLFLAVLAQGRWTPRTRRLDLALSLLTCAVLAWVVADGPIFLTATSDRTTKLLLGLVVACVLIGIGVRLYRNVKPSPAVGASMQR